jgi:hypothetical protein
MLGFCPDDVTNAPAGAVSFLAQQLGVDPGALAGYGVRAQTRTDHEAQVRRHLGFRVAAEADLRELRRWLTMEALVTDRPIVLFQLACARLYEERLVRPGLTVMERFLVGAAREAARAETARRVAPVLKAVGVGVLDGLLEADPDLGAARATWLRQSPVQASARAMNEEADKLEFLRQLGVESWDLSTLPGKRVTLLAGWARRSSTQALAQSSAERRYPALLAFGVDRLAGAIDTLVELFDTMVADTNAKARRGWVTTSSRSPTRPTTRFCSWPRSPGSCSTPTSRTTSASQPCSLRYPRTAWRTPWPSASASPAPPTTATSTCWVTTIRSCVSASPGGSRCCVSGP